MMESLDTTLERSNQTKRSESWKEILNIVNRISQLEFEPTTRPLQVDNAIGPKLPTSSESIRNLEARTQRAVPSPSADGLHARVDQLRERVLIEYTESISKMASSSEFTGVDDSVVQHNHSRSFEAWFDRAVRELFTAVTNGSQYTCQPPRGRDADPDILQQAFKVNPNPNDKERELLANASGCTYKQVTTWFQNHRQRVKSHPIDQHATAEKTSAKQAARKPRYHVPARPVAAIPKASAGKHRKQKAHDAQSEQVSTLPPTGTSPAAARVTSRSNSDDRQQELRVGARNSGVAAFANEATLQHQHAPSSHSSAGSSLSNAVVPPKGELRPLKRLPGIRKLSSVATSLTSAKPALVGTIENNANMPSSAEDAGLSSVVTGTSFERERIPSLTRSVSSASTVSVGEIPQPHDEPLFAHHPQTLPSRGAITAQARDGQNNRLEAVSFSTPTKTTYGERQPLLTHAPFQPLAAVQAPTYRHPMPPAQIQNVQQHHTLPSVSTMIPPGASPVQPNLYQMMRDEAGNQFLVQVNSIIPMPVQPSYLPYQQPPYTRYVAHEQDLRSVSYAVQGTPDDNRFEKIETPPASVQSHTGTRFSSPESSVEQTPSPYPTPEMQVKRTAALASTIVGYTGLEPNIPHGPSQTLPSPAEIDNMAQKLDVLFTDDILKGNFAPENIQRVPDLSVDGVSFSFAELEAGNFVLDEGTLRDMEALLAMEPVTTAAPVVDLNSNAADPPHGHGEEKHKKNEGNQTQIQRKEEYLPNTTGTPKSESSDATVEVVFGQDGSNQYGSTASIAPVQIHTAAPMHAPTPVYDLNGFNAAGKTGQGVSIMGYASQQTSMPCPPSVPMSQTRSAETISPSDIRISHAQPRVDAPIQVQHHTPAQDQYVYSQPQSRVYSMQEQPQPQPQPLAGWKYEWEFGVLPFETIPAGEMWTY